MEQRRYRFRFLNGCQSRFLILDFNQIPGVEVWAIGNEGGFLSAPVNLTATNNNRLLMALAERSDLIVDFTNVPVGNYVLGNVGPDEPFGGGVPDADFDVADPATTGQIMQFNVVPAVAADPTTPPQFLQLPAIVPLPAETVTRPLALIEMMGDGLRRRPALQWRARSKRFSAPWKGEAVWTERKWMEPVDREPGRRSHGGLGVLQHDRRRASDARPRDRLRGREPRGTGARLSTVTSCSRSSSTGSSPRRSPGRPGSRTP